LFFALVLILVSGEVVGSKSGECVVVVVVVVQWWCLLNIGGGGKKEGSCDARRRVNRGL